MRLAARTACHVATWTAACAGAGSSDAAGPLPPRTVAVGPLAGSGSGSGWPAFHRWPVGCGGVTGLWPGQSKASESSSRPAAFALEFCRASRVFGLGTRARVVLVPIPRQLLAAGKKQQRPTLPVVFLFCSCKRPQPPSVCHVLTRSLTQLIPGSNEKERKKESCTP